MSRKPQRGVDFFWNKTGTLKVLTLDKLIEQFGRPKYIKLDIEGYEVNALKGLSEALDIVSFEFTPECEAAAVECVHLLDSMNNYRYNLIEGDNTTFSL